MAYAGGTFAVTAAGRISGALVERIRFATHLIFIARWSLLGYPPTTRWLRGDGSMPS
ncbi:MAG: hypothetical protein ABI910_16005 [Gemmatimonadota bacterium]